MPDVIVLNGGSSSGKSSIARALQSLLPEAWLSLSVDTFVDALPASLQDSPGGIAIGPGGEITVGPAFRTLDAAWTAGVAAMARAGAHVVVDDVFLGGADSQARWSRALTGLDVLWAGVHCAPDVAAAREAARGDREPGMAAKQALLVHEGVTYDVEVDSTHCAALACARTIASRISRTPRR
ncbi:chloramphenicol phosphotransferase CPT [Actinacidiphila epipremni]|uniref:Chloramphenicol phosphotransferase CPT n=1 Tax=Actinacidiphila epipremni TaxID=2053013 RepID=A0ABX1A177_9ACTN|nr:chloramphenicol phosphotransferase CPT [Actinacidiphila epipremni]NJP47669.1 chloramphenicol phosphotransferase CPT [Actinacidiphila epipremni]